MAMQKSGKYGLILTLIVVCNIIWAGSCYAQKDSQGFYDTEIKKVSDSAQALKWRVRKMRFAQRSNQDSIVRREAQAIIRSQGRTKDSLSLGAAYLAMGRVEDGIRNTEEALKYLIQAERYFAGNRAQLAKVIAIKGETFYAAKDYLHAIQYLKEGGEMARMQNDSFIQYVSVTDLGNIYYEQSQYDSSLPYYFKGLDFLKGTKDSLRIEILYSNIGNVYVAKGENSEGKSYLKKAMALAERLKLIVALPVIYYNLAGVERNLKNYKEARSLLNKSRRAGAIINNKYNLTFCLRLGALVDSVLGKPDSARLELRQLIALTDSLYGSDLYSRMAEMQTKFDLEKKNGEILIQNKGKKVAEVKLERERLIFVLVSGALFLLLILTGLLYRNTLARKRANLLLQTQQKNVQKRKAELEYKNQQVLDSIHYAQRIQDAILPLPLFRHSEVNDHFVFFLPKEKVSGDFYWRYEEGDNLYFAAVDCTGHGVPGAMMSMLAFDMLEYVMNDLKRRNPKDILHALNNLIVEKLHKSNPEGAKDGMDISLCKLNLKTNTLYFAGAWNDLVLVRGGEISQLAADKQSIGYAPDLHYAEQVLELREQDMIYLASDGYADQKGGPEGKKFMQRRLKQMLAEISISVCADQKNRLEEEFSKWRGNQAQRDDILIIGLRCKG
jgi:serine phosphatase RsbU (regulator of sigma subunit)